MRIGQRFYCLHICEGVANYPEMKKMLLLREETLRKMDPTMSGVPVVFNTEHLTQQEGEELAKADRKGAFIEGIVNKSFFNEHDGRHWCEIQVWDENALAAIAQGIAVSNAYVINSKAPGGEYHAVKYDLEVMDGEYDHLLITARPRYEEAKILTPEQFEAYNKSRAEKLALVTNSKESSMTVLKTFERKAVEFLLDGKEVEGPKSKKMILITNAIEAMDNALKEKEDAGGEEMANMSHKVKVGNSTKSLHELMDCYNAVMKERDDLKAENDQYKAEGEEDVENANETPEEKKSREEKEKAENEKDEKDKAEKEKAENQKKEAILIKNKKLAASRIAGPADVARRIENAKRSNEDSPFEQPVIRLREDAVEAGLKSYGAEN